MDNPRPFVIENSHAHDFVARSNGQNYRLWVATPAKRVPGQVRPVLYTTDANTSFATMVETTRMLSFSGDIPPVIVVGLGYPTGRASDAMRLRNFELTPTADPAHVENATAQGIPIDERGLGGAAGFHQFIVEEVAPFVEETYGGDPADRCLYGYSLGGLFAAWALLQQPLAFQRVIAGSPSLWWDDRVLFELEAKRAEASRSLPARLYLSAGEDEEAPARKGFARFKMVSNAIEFAARIASREYEGLEVEMQLIPRVGHQAPPMLVQGLQWVYRGHPGIVRPA